MSVDDYLTFVAERAAWLGIDGWVEARDTGVTIVAAGQEAMVGALEMACVLGPLSALVHTVEVAAEPNPVAAGFEVRQK